MLLGSAISQLLIAVGGVAERAVARGVSADRISAGGGFVLPEDLFCAERPELDLAALQSALSAVEAEETKAARETLHKEVQERLGSSA